MSNIPQVGFISLGCPKATVDSERILTQLRAEGYLITPSYNEADLVVVNTCGFIEAAVDESLDAIGEALQENGKVVVTGCLGAKAEMIQQRHPHVLAVTGPNSLEAVMDAIHAVLPPQHDPYLDIVPPGGIKLTPRHYAYLKIAEGCNQSCSFCIIPSLRGRLASRPIGDILQEAESLVSAGVTELLIVSQDTAAYGSDTRYQLGFWRGKPLKTRIEVLAKALGELGVWVRLHYVYPYPHVDHLVDLMADGVVLPYLDIPLQHGSPTILKAMRRPANAENILQRLAAWRESCPELTIRSTFIVGFPGETAEDFQTLLEFVEAAQLDRVGTFAYSPVAGAAANALANPVSEALKQERLATLMELQEKISQQKLQARVGQTIAVVIDEITPTTLYARSAAEAPEVDGNVLIDTAGAEWDVAIGDLVETRLVGVNGHDLLATFE